MKYRLLFFLLAFLLILSSCQGTDSTLSHSAETTARPVVENTDLCLYVNTSAKKIHYSRECRYLKQSKEENILSMSYSAETLEDLHLMDFVNCNNCSHPDHKE